MTSVPASDALDPPRGVERALAGRRRKYEDEVDRLVEAAFRVMQAQDTATPTVTDILREAGMSTKAFYRHFPTKDDLLLTLLERAHHNTRSYLAHQLDSVAGGPDAAPDRIVTWINGMLDLLRTDRLVAANRPFLLAHPRLVERFPSEINAFVTALTEPLARAIGDARRSAGLDEGDAVGDARLVHYQVFAILIERAAERRTSDPALVSQITQYTLRAVLGDAQVRNGPGSPSSST